MVTEIYILRAEYFVYVNINVVLHHSFILDVDICIFIQNKKDDTSK